jgi:hypothetical protein
LRSKKEAALAASLEQKAKPTSLIEEEDEDIMF